jgi:carboxypeptidase family protein
MRSYLVVGLCVVLGILCLTTQLLAQRSDRGIITGIVLDATGSALAGADVKVRNEGTAVETKLVSNSAGAYTTPPLVLGTYTVTVDHPGFKSSVNSGIQLQGAETIRKDVTMTVGAVTESVEVKADVELNVTTPDISHVVDERYYQDIPTITAADVRLAEAVLQIQPGYLPMKPNGDPMFRGSQFNSRINGGQSMATENFFDGAAFGYAVGHQQSQESAPPIESIQEVKVITTSFAAQYGHTSGGFIEYTSKPGTNTLHGSAYEFFANDALNARGFFDADCNAGVCKPRKKTPLKNNSFGFTLGGPVVIPHVYDGHNKTFFFTNFDWTRLRSGVLPGFGNTTPIDAFKTGDFSSWPDQIYNPYSTSVNSSGVASRAPFACDGAGNPITPNLAGGPGTPGYGIQVGGTPCNKLPTELLSTVATRVAGLMVHPDRAQFSNNVAGNPAGDQTWLLNARTIEFRVDHSFTPNFRMSESFYWGHRPSIRNCGEVAGCTTQFSGETSPEKNTSYYGNGFYQRIATHHTHTQFDWIIRPNLLNHTTIAWDRWFMGGNPLSAGAGWPGILWAGTPGAANPLGNGGLLDQTAGPPLLDFAGNIPYNSLGQYGWGKFGFLTNNRWQFSDDLSWVKGKHTLKFGFEYRWHQFPFSGWANGNQAGEFRFDRRETAGYDSTGNIIVNSGESFASFLLGQVDSSTQNIPFHPMFYEAYTSPWINDEYKATSRLTLTLGLRFDYQFARTETQDRYSSFDPLTPNPGAGGLPGALLFAGKGAGRTGKRTFENPDHNAWGPRLGFAYRVNDKTALRGGYGIYYSGISFDQFIGQPTLGYVANPTVSNISNGEQPAFFLDNGFPQTNVACPGGTPTSPCVNPPPFIDPSFANNQSVIAVAKNGLTLPRYQNWSLTFERQLNANLRLDVSYIANRGTRLTADWQKMGVAANMNPSSVLSIPNATLKLNCSLVNSAAGLCAGGVPLPYDTFNGSVAQALRKYPQYQNVLWRDVPLGSSMYNALEVVLEQRYSHGLGFRVGYTYSRLNNDGSETGQGGDGANGSVQDPSCPHKCEWGLSRDDTPHVFLVGFTWEIPFGKGLSSRPGRFVLGGWNLAGALRYESGRPMNITMDNPLGGLLFNGQRRPNRVKGVTAVKRGSSFNPLTDNYFNKAAWSDPDLDPDTKNPLLGNAPRRDGSVRAFPTYNEDINVFKVFPLKERLNLRFEAQFGNIFNRTDFCDPNGFYSAATFGTVSTQCNQPRSIQFGLRLNY